ncbi:hypothetical protein CC78DRAFT_566845 [Lojkania enalia]|uniref:DUF7730 domain-containing protein n=1 Tax=Lojkania enalia TaxID=147567 RepID=A0A9P4KEZ7_9PLEO|nr:hypothetical protein CC78DRAFT_566845 [Didymosphaeria enalia]
MASNTSTPRSRSSTASSGSSDTTMHDAPPLTPVRPRPSSHPNPSAATDMTSRDPSFSLLLSLPQELRDRVYLYALSSPFPFWWPSPVSPPHNVAVNLLTVSRQVYEEAAPILYSSNKFLFTHPSDCSVFRVVASPKYSALISSVCFRIREKDLRLWTTYLGSKSADRSLKADLPKLKSLWIFVRCGSIGTPHGIGQIGGQLAGLPPGIAAQVQAVQNALGQQVQAIQQQVASMQHANGQPVQINIQPAQHIAFNPNNPAQGQFPGAPNGNINGGANNNIPPVPPPAPTIPFSNFAQTGIANYLQATGQTFLQAAGHQHHNPAPHIHGQVPLPTHMAHQLAAPQQQQNQHQHIPPHPHHHHHPPFYHSFLRWEREIGLENLCLSLQETRPADSEVKIVCIMRLPKPEVLRLTRLYPDELAVDRNGDARTRFRKLHGVEVSLEVSGYDVST